MSEKKVIKPKDIYIGDIDEISLDDLVDLFDNEDIDEFPGYEGDPYENPYARASFMIGRSRSLRPKKLKKAMLYKALDICADAFYAYTILADLETNPKKELELLKTAVNMGRSVAKLDLKSYDNYTDLLMFSEYLKSVRAYADKLFEMGRTEEAMVNYEHLIEIDRADMTATRVKLIPIYILENRNKDAYNLSDEFIYDESLPMQFHRVLIYYRLGLYENAKELLYEANSMNKYVIRYIIGDLKVSSKDLNSGWRAGSKKEAIEYCLISIRAWVKTLGIIDFLIDFEKENIKIDSKLIN